MKVFKSGQYNVVAIEIRSETHWIQYQLLLQNCSDVMPYNLIMNYIIM